MLSALNEGILEHALGIFGHEEMYRHPRLRTLKTSNDHFHYFRNLSSFCTGFIDSLFVFDYF